MGDDNRYIISGEVIELDEFAKVISPYFKKRQCKIRKSDVDFTGKICERKIRIDFQNDDVDLLNIVEVGYIVQIRFLLDGRDVTKNDQIYNFTAPVGYDVVVLSTGAKATEEDKNAVITGDGMQYKPIITLASIDDAIRANIDKYTNNEDPLFGKLEKKEDGKDKSPIFDDLPF
jgi:hypothetical protein